MNLKKLELGLFIVFLVISIFSVLPIGFSNESKEQLFRPLYLGYAHGTTTINANTNITTTNDQGFHREWNLIGWNVSKFTMMIRFCLPYWEANIFEWTLPFIMTLYISLDKGETFNISRTIDVPSLHFKSNQIWSDANASGPFYYADFHYDFPSSDFELFTPGTRLICKFNKKKWLANAYWGSAQKPVPPFDYQDPYDTYVQYYIFFNVEYTKQTINYLGENVTYPAWTKTKAKIKQASNMILNCMHPSGATDEVTDKKFGTDTWIIIYSAQLAMMELIDLCSIFPEQASTYLVAIKRFIVWMWSKQNQTDGSFPFILTDGDQHPWYNATSGDYYGYDKIDSFSACAISLMRKYYSATLDTDFINQYWNQIIKCSDFIDDLTDKTVWLPVDGYHYDGTSYVKSESTWLHDICESYQGLKDLAWLYGTIKNDDAKQDYWNAFAENISSSTRERMWNETLQRYVGMYHINNETQNEVLVYNIITPTIYTLETNSTRAWKTVDSYRKWGTMTGRYLNQKWAPDYSVYNEYSTMSGMILSSFAELNKTYNYHNQWMNDKFDDVTHFLFANPLYPYNDGDLQNNNGILDWVNFENKTWSVEYARLIETSAWFIDGMMKLPYMTGLFDGDEPWWERLPSYDFWLPIMFIFGMFGIVSTIGGAMYTVQQIKKRNYDRGFTNGVIWVTLGVCLVLAWLWG